MAKCRPSKWVPWALPGVVLPLLAAYATTSGGLMEDVRSRAGQMLSSQEETSWAKVESDGRDYVVQGTAPSQEALDAAVKAVAGTYGVRTVAQTVQIVEPVKMTAPTVESLNVATATPELKGSWHEGVATGLVVGVGGATYKLGESPELTSMGGEWLLKVPQPLAEGSYDVTAESTDGKTTLAAATPGKLVVDLPDPVPAPEVKLPLPTVESYLGNAATPMFKGTWPETEAKAAGKNLQVKLGENLAVLGSNPELTSDGAGNWTLVPATPLLEGELEIMPGLVGEDGKWIKAEAPGKVTIDLTPPPMPELVPVATGAVWPFALSGKWLEEAGSKLATTFAGKTYQMGTDPALTSDGKGTFTFDPKVELAPGSYDLDVNVTDAAGNTVSQKLAAAVVIPEPVKVEPLKVAILDPVSPDSRVVTGTWDERPGHTLEAAVAGRNYVLGRGSALTSDGAGKFTFAPAAKFAPGSYDVDITTTDLTGAKQVVTAKAAIVIPEPVVAPEPAKPAVMDAIPADAKWPYPITGNWDERPGHVLEASVAGRTYVLGRGSALTSDGAGKFTFSPAAKFVPGNYDVDFITTDLAGAKQVVTAKAAIVIPEPVVAPEPAKPAVMDAIPADAKWPFPISGMWDERPGNTLAATLAGRNYALGRGAALTSDGSGRFTFAAQVKLPPGTYDVDFVTTDAGGASVVTTAKAAIVVPEAAPAPEPEPTPAPVIEIPAPTVMSQVDVTGAPIIKGTWPHMVAKGLTVTLNNRTYVLGGDANLNTRNENWTLLPGSALANGTYDVVAEANDGGSVSTKDTTSGELTVNVPPPPPPPAPEPTVIPYDCVAVMTRIGNVFPIRFEYDRTDITKPFDTSVSQYAALLNDPRCTSINVEIEGHADFRGSEMYNMGLSERRADVIRGMLENVGVKPERMTVKGLGESAPLDPETTDEARMKNRRVQITAKP